MSGRGGGICRGKWVSMAQRYARLNWNMGTNTLACTVVHNQQWGSMGCTNHCKQYTVTSIRGTRVQCFPLPFLLNVDRVCKGNFFIFNTQKLRNSVVQCLSRITWKQQWGSNGPSQRRVVTWGFTYHHQKSSHQREQCTQVYNLY